MFALVDLSFPIDDSVLVSLLVYREGSILVWILLTFFMLENICIFLFFFFLHFSSFCFLFFSYYLYFSSFSSYFVFLFFLFLLLFSSSYYFFLFFLVPCTCWLILNMFCQSALLETGGHISTC